jgi:ribosomal protein L21
MYAIVEIAGQQFKVQKDRKVYVHRIEGEEGSSVSFDRVLLLDNDGSITVGAPAIDGAKVTARIEKHLKGDKVLVFKKKRRKGYQKLIWWSVSYFGQYYCSSARNTPQSRRRRGNGKRPYTICSCRWYGCFP